MLTFVTPKSGFMSSYFEFVLLLLFSTGIAFQIPSTFLQSSILVSFLARIVLVDELQNAVISVHPLTVIGCEFSVHPLLFGVNFFGLYLT